MRTMVRRALVGVSAAVVLAAWIFPILAAAQAPQAAPQAIRERPGRMPARGALDLTPEQEKALAEFRKAREAERASFRDELAKLGTEMRELAKDPKANQSKMDALIDRTAKLRAEGQKAALRNRIERDKIFTPEQLERFKALRERLAVRPGRIGRGRMAVGRWDFRRPGRFLGPGSGPQRLARLRALRPRPLRRRWLNW
jgi:Spy/CpxP family protein refolding chaperone